MGCQVFLILVGCQVFVILVGFQVFSLRNEVTGFLYCSGSGFPVVGFWLFFFYNFFVKKVWVPV